MAIVHIRVGNREYDVACDDGQEDHLRLLADEVDERVRSLIFSMGSNINEGLALLLTSLTMADELLESKKEVRAVALEVQKISRQLDAERQNSQLAQVEAAMAHTLEDIALRIEKIADQIEIQ
jgi:cell division protein ZapA